jgi:hypothetical protein
MRLVPAALIVLAASGAPALHAAEPMTGRWAADPSSCAEQDTASAQAVLVVSNEAMRWAGDTCRIGRSYRTGNTLHVEAFCSGKGRKRRIPVSLRLHGDRVFVIWNRAARGDLRRCP